MIFVLLASENNLRMFPILNRVARIIQNVDDRSNHSDWVDINHTVRALVFRLNPLGMFIG